MVPKHADGRFLKLPLRYLLRVGVLRSFPRNSWPIRVGVQLPDVIVGKVPGRSACYVAHELEAFVCRFALWLNEHMWDLERLALRCGLMVGEEGDYYVNARWFWQRKRSTPLSLVVPSGNLALMAGGRPGDSFRVRKD